MSQKDNYYIYGRKPVVELSDSKLFQISKVFVKNSIAPYSYRELTATLEANSIPIVSVPEIKLENLVGKVNHQGFVALISEISYTNFYDWVEELDLRGNPAVLFLDGIEDPHNFGAILRTAAAAGMEAVIIPVQNQSPVTATVMKTSAGTAGKLPIIRVHDTNQGIKDLKLAGFKLVALNASAKKTLWQETFDSPTAFIIGNEGRGVHPATLKKCDKIVMLPMQNQVESLNASVTAALVAYEWQRRKLIVE